MPPGSLVRVVTGLMLVLQLLGAGATPLDVLETRMDLWLENQLTEATR